VSNQLLRVEPERITFCQFEAFSNASCNIGSIRRVVPDASLSVTAKLIPTNVSEVGADGITNRCPGILISIV